MTQPLDGHFTKLDHGFNNVRKCLKCGWEWVKRQDDEPRQCPRCRTEKWNQDQRGGDNNENNATVVKSHRSP